MRDAQRDATRARILVAAQELFLEHGYEATTVRMLAERAELSPAGLFTTFADKADILHHVRMAQSQALRAEVERIAPELTGSAADRICALVRLCYEREWPHLPLVVAWIGASQGGWGEATERDSRAEHRGMFAAFDHVLADGAAKGELRPDFDVPLARELIYGTYIGNFRRAWYARWTAPETADHVERKLRLIFNGLRV